MKTRFSKRNKECDVKNTVKVAYRSNRQKYEKVDASSSRSSAKRTVSRSYKNVHGVGDRQSSQFVTYSQDDRLFYDLYSKSEFGSPSCQSRELGKSVSNAAKAIRIAASPVLNDTPQSNNRMKTKNEPCENLKIKRTSREAGLNAAAKVRMSCNTYRSNDSEYANLPSSSRVSKVGKKRRKKAKSTTKSSIERKIKRELGIDVIPQMLPYGKRIASLNAVALINAVTIDKVIRKTHEKIPTSSNESSIQVVQINEDKHENQDFTEKMDDAATEPMCNSPDREVLPSKTLKKPKRSVKSNNRTRRNTRDKHSSDPIIQVGPTSAVESYHSEHIIPLGDNKFGVQQITQKVICVDKLSNKLCETEVHLHSFPEPVETMSNVTAANSSHIPVSPPFSNPSCMIPYQYPCSTPREAPVLSVGRSMGTWNPITPPGPPIPQLLSTQSGPYFPFSATPSYGQQLLYPPFLINNTLQQNPATHSVPVTPTTYGNIGSIYPAVSSPLSFLQPMHTNNVPFNPYPTPLCFPPSNPSVVPQFLMPMWPNPPIPYGPVAFNNPFLQLPVSAPVMHAPHSLTSVPAQASCLNVLQQPSLVSINSSSEALTIQNSSNSMTEPPLNCSTSYVTPTYTIPLPNMHGVTTPEVLPDRNAPVTMPSSSPPRMSSSVVEDVTPTKPVTPKKKESPRDKFSLRNAETWDWEGDPYNKSFFDQSESLPTTRLCYRAIRHRRDGMVIRERDNALLCSGPDRSNAPHVAKITALFQDEKTGSKMMSLLWYYRPESIVGSQPAHSVINELYASRHCDVNSVDCIEDKAYVLSFSSFGRFMAQLKHRYSTNPRPRLNQIVPPSSYVSASRIAFDSHDCVERFIRVEDDWPDSVPLSNVFLCRGIYDYRLRRICKNVNFHTFSPHSHYLTHLTSHRTRLPTIDLESDSLSVPVSPSKLPLPSPKTTTTTTVSHPPTPPTISVDDVTELNAPVSDQSEPPSPVLRIASPEPSPENSPHAQDSCRVSTVDLDTTINEEATTTNPPQTVSLNGLVVDESPTPGPHLLTSLPEESTQELQSTPVKQMSVPVTLVVNDALALSSPCPQSGPSANQLPRSVSPHWPMLLKPPAPPPPAAVCVPIQRLTLPTCAPTPSGRLNNNNNWPSLPMLESSVLETSADLSVNWADHGEQIALSLNCRTPKAATTTMPDSNQTSNQWQHASQSTPTSQRHTPLTDPGSHAPVATLYRRTGGQDPSESTESPRLVIL